MVFIRDAKDLHGNQKFADLGNFALDMLVLTHSSADYERVFSKTNIIKTPLRNKLHSTTLRATMLSAQCVKNCIQFELSEEMIAINE